MTRYLLDTNIVSDLSRQIPSASLLAWFAGQADDDLFIASMTVAEIRKGILDLPLGKRRLGLESWFVGPAGPKALFPGRVLPFDEDAALEWATLIIDGKKNGRPRDVLDTIIAATAIVNRCVVVTANERDFAGVDTFNPLAPPR